MALNAWQLLTRVLPGQPFGTGVDGALTISASATQTLTDETCTGTADATALTAGGTSLANGDVVMIHQTRGTGAGQWEINKVASGGGSVNLVMSTALHYSYASGAQVIKIPQYTDVTVNSSQTWSAKEWDGSIGGFLVFAANGTVTISGTLSGDAKGFLQGASPGETSGTANGFRGEGTSGDNQTRQTGSNGNGGGGGTAPAGGWYGAGGGGGGHAAAGTDGQRIDANATFGSGGSTGGDANLASMVFGGAGGAGASDYEANSATAYGGPGGDGGGGIVIFGKTIASPNSLTADGQDGGNAEYAPDGGAASNPHGGGGGAGAGGSILICGYTVNVGTDKFTVTGGTGGTPSRSENNFGGAGAKGRIAVYYGLSLTGTISSSLYGTYTNAQDTSLVEASSSFFLMF